MLQNKWQIINKDYLKYLRKYENRIPFYDYGSDKMKPFFNILFEIDNLVYVTQVTHPKTRHYNMIEQLDFFKIYDNNNKLLCAVNLNYMFLVPIDEMKELQYKDIDLYCTFQDNIKKSKYIKLLQTEMKFIRTRNFDEKALKVYQNKYQNPNSKIAQRCLDFKQLEIYAEQWEENKLVDKNYI